MPVCHPHLLSGEPGVSASESFFARASHVDSWHCLSLCSTSIDLRGCGLCCCLLGPVSGHLLSSLIHGLCPLPSPVSCPVHDCGFLPYFISFPLFCEVFGQGNRKACVPSSIPPTPKYNNLRRTTTGLSCFLPALKTRKLTSDFLKGAWELFWEHLCFCTSVKRIESPTGISA